MDERFTASGHVSWRSLHRAAYVLLGDPGLAEDFVPPVLANT